MCAGPLLCMSWNSPEHSDFIFPKQYRVYYSCPKEFSKSFVFLVVYKTITGLNRP